MSEEIVSGSQTETTPEVTERDAETEALYDSFGLAPRPEKKEIAFPEGNGQVESDEDPPAIEDEEEEQKPEPRKVKVKFDKEDREVEVTDDNLPEYLQKALALDRERERKTAAEKELDEAAQLLGFKDRADYLANKADLLKKQEEKRETEFKNLKQQMIQEYEEAGYDPSKLQEWLDGHPVLKRAEEVLQREQSARIDAEWNNKWSDLYRSHPDLVDSATSFSEGKMPEWYNDEMQSLVKQGYHPKHAYEIVHRDKIEAQTRKTIEQQALKQQRLGVRARVTGDAPSDTGDVGIDPITQSLAEEFGVSVKGVRQQKKILESRR